MTDKPVATSLPAQGLILLAILTLIWGASWPIMKVAVEGMPIFTFRSVSGIGGGLVLMLIAKLSGYSLAIPRAIWKPLVLASFFNITCWMLFSAIALTLIPSGHAAVVAYTMPVWAFVFSIPMLGEKARKVQWLGLVLGMTAVAVLAARGWSVLGEAPWGVLVMAGGAVLWAIGTVLNKRTEWPMPIMVVTCWQILLGTLPMALMMAFEVDDLVMPTPIVAAAVAFSGLIGMAVGFWTWFRIIEMVPAPVAALSVLVVPAAGLVFGALLLGENFGYTEIIALGCLMAALATVLPKPDAKT